MFVSHPHYQFAFPEALGDPGAQHWRVVELTLHAPWFLLSVEIFDEEIPACSMTRTLLIAWDDDLADMLRSLHAERVMGIVCMMPAWQSTNGQWSSREIREVWICSSAAGQSVLLLDAAGEEFDCGLVPEHVEPMTKELLLRVAPAAPRRAPHSQRTTPASGSRRGHRSRQANARKAGA